MTTNRKGNISEAQVLNAFVQAECLVWLPFGNGSAYDLIADFEGHLLKVQVKTGRLRMGVVLFPVRRFSGHLGREGKYKSRKYDEGEIDLFAVHCPDNDSIYLIPAQLGIEITAGRLRVTSTKNNQQQKIRWASDFEFAAVWEKLKERFGGAKGDRTPDLLTASQALFQAEL